MHSVTTDRPEAGVIELKISEIQIVTRHRRNYGDLAALAASVEEVGLLQPVGVTPDRRLVFGERRLRACRDILRWDTIPARIVAVGSVLLGEIAENVVRQDYTVSERVAIAEALRGFTHGGDRRSDRRRTSGDEPLTLDEAAKRAGLGGKDGYFRAKAVIDGGVPELVEAMDGNRISVSAAAEVARLAPEEQIAVVAGGPAEVRRVAQTTRRGRRTGRAGPPPARIEPAPIRVALPPAGGGPDAGPPAPADDVASPLVAVNAVAGGDCLGLIPYLPDRGIDLVLTSPPYAEQRDGHYPGVPAAEYPQFTVRWMAKVWDKLADGGCVLIVIDPHVEDGVVADYVLRTQLALREFGWRQHRPLVWYKPDALPLGDRRWPRHSYEQILCFSKTGRPYCDPLACGRPTGRLPVGGHWWSSNPNEPEALTDGTARSRDVLVVPVGANEPGIDHPARFPVSLADGLVRTFCPPGGSVLDPFCGSGTTLVAAATLGRTYYGFDIVPTYCSLARQRLSDIRLAAAVG